MILGVKTKELIRRVDDRGFFMEILRDDDQLLQKFGQFSMAMTYPGVIKAFHYHKLQDDLWFFPKGEAQVVLYDLREDSKTRGETDVYYLGELQPWLLTIPAGVAHGYRVLGGEPALITYLTTQSYDRLQPDEYRIPWDDPTIGFDWRTHNR
ncbi:dTDP-4-dehydrorhamnose 3,5-epimerase [Hydrogenispora ethanolica]|uniref:dTDP-4-dehydrorhamnose 3,5-epimerase n=1 Tax=Hydrogenispora ethanolica TaxID=1082276 RepID=A0A4R1RVU5_HYDET|nr:dTDP-4-dehydrorhamnose 3,5-epimerase family protein [Hydrogenispora ethanolica]TCL70778.1 dTDP-4-dehydrorhamnose 3,5-epimerase [Hydrogenispora ethanolica]